MAKDSCGICTASAGWGLGGAGWSWMGLGGAQEALAFALSLTFWETVLKIHVQVKMGFR